MLTSWNQFLLRERADTDTIDVKKCYIDLAGDIVSGLLLSQIIYWHLPAKDGRERMTVKRDGYLWIAKRREHWWHECRITVRQYDRAIKALSEPTATRPAIVATGDFQFGRIRMAHIRILRDEFLEALAKVIEAGAPDPPAPDPEDVFSPSDSSYCDETSQYKTTKRHNANKETTGRDYVKRDLNTSLPKDHHDPYDREGECEGDSQNSTLELVVKAPQVQQPVSELLTPVVRKASPVASANLSPVISDNRTSEESAVGSTAPTTAPKESPLSCAAAPLTEAPAPTKKRGKAKKPELPLPTPFEVTVEMQRWSAENCPLVNWKLQTTMMANWARGKGIERADWILTWKNWLLREQNQASERSSRSPARNMPGRNPDGSPRLVC